jgi:hypothetical protein
MSATPSEAAQTGLDATDRGTHARQAQRRHLLGPWELLLLALATVAFIACFVVPVDYDYWWHLADGRYMLANHALPAPDPFSFTAAGRPLVVHEWLTELPMYGLHQAFGIRGPLALFALCTVAIVLLTVRTLRRMGTGRGATLILNGLMLAAIWLFTGARPQVAGFALFATEICLIERWIHCRDRSIWALPPLLWLWSNLHSSFAIGLALPAAVLGGDLIASWLNWHAAVRMVARGRLLLTAALAVSVALVLANPNGLPLLVYPVAKLHDPLAKEAIAEWMSTDISSPLFWPFALLAGGYLVVVALRRPRLPLSDLMLALALTAAGLSARKYVPFAVMVLTVLIGRVLSQPDRGNAEEWSVFTKIAGRFGVRKRQSAPRTLLGQWIYVPAILILTYGLVRTVRRTDPMSAVRENVPVAAIDTLGAKGLRGPLFNDYSWGGYLIWRLWPQVRVFIDGRGDMYISGGEFRDYLEVTQLRSGADSILDRYAIRQVLVLKDSPLTRYLLAEGKWQATYDDGRFVRLERTPDSGKP